MASGDLIAVGGGFDFTKYTPFNKSITPGANPVSNTWKNALTINGAGILTGVLLQYVSTNYRALRITIDGTIVYRARNFNTNGGGLGILVDGFTYNAASPYVGLMLVNGTVGQMGWGSAVKRELPYLNATDTTNDGSFIHSTFPIKFNTSLVIDVASDSTTDSFSTLYVNGAIKN